MPYGSLVPIEEGLGEVVIIPSLDQKIQAIVNNPNLTIKEMKSEIRKLHGYSPRQKYENKEARKIAAKKRSAEKRVLIYAPLIAAGKIKPKGPKRTDAEKESAKLRRRALRQSDKIAFNKWVLANPDAAREIGISNQKIAHLQTVATGLPRTERQRSAEV